MYFYQKASLIRKSVKKIILICCCYCCYLEHIVFPTFTCQNPNNLRGQCVSIVECPNLLKLIEKVNLSVEEKQFLRASQCFNGEGRKPYICCVEDDAKSSMTSPITSHVTSAPYTEDDDRKPIWSNGRSGSNPGLTNPRTTNSGSGHLLPEPPNCGPEPLGNRIYSGNETRLDQYPWMVLLEYLRSKLTKILYRN